MCMCVCACTYFLALFSEGQGAVTPSCKEHTQIQVSVSKTCSSLQAPRLLREVSNANVRTKEMYGTCFRK